MKPFAGEDVVEPVKCRGAAEVRGLGRIERPQRRGGSYYGSGGNPVLPVDELGRKRPDALLIAEQVRQ